MSCCLVDNDSYHQILKQDNTDTWPDLFLVMGYSPKTSMSTLAYKNCIQMSSVTFVNIIIHFFSVLENMGHSADTKRTNETQNKKVLC